MLAKVKVFTSLDATALEKDINIFLEENPEANAAIHYTVGTTPDKENKNINVTLYTAMLYYNL